MQKTMVCALAFAALAGCAEEGVAFETAGQVRRAEGASPVRAGAECTVGIANESRGGYPCRVSVTCGGHTLYGGSQPGGYARCSTEQGEWVRATDDMLESVDGDPWMDFDVRGGTVVVRTRSATTEIAIEPHASAARLVASVRSAHPAQRPATTTTTR